MNPRDFLVQFAQGYLGVTEATGRNDGPYVEMFQQWTDGVAQGESWCMAFVQFCVGNVAQQYGFPAQLFASEHCLTVWNNSQRLAIYPPYPGSVVIWQRPGTTNGHTGIVTGVDLDNGVFTTIEGNTSGGGGLESNGDGVYQKVRSFQGDGNFSLVGFLDPFAGQA
jgi:hypothetical protein